MWDKETFDAVASLATLATALAALFTILEMRRQRRSTHRADLIPLSASFILAENIKDSYSPWSLLANSDVVEDETPRGLHVDILSVGAGRESSIRAHLPTPPHDLPIAHESRQHLN
jgi:hypothetical protein